MAPTGDRQGVCSQLTLDCRRGWWEPLRVDGSPQAQTFHSSLASALPPLPRDSRKEITPWRLERLYGRRNGRRQFLRPHLFPPWQEVSSSPQSGAPSGWSRKPVSSPDHPWNTRPCICTDVGRTRTPSSLATEGRWPSSIRGGCVHCCQPLGRDSPPGNYWSVGWSGVSRCVLGTPVSGPRQPLSWEDRKGV